MNTPHRFDRFQLLKIREKPCVCLPRIVRRRLFYFNILVHHIKTAINVFPREEVIPEETSVPRTLTRVKRTRLNRGRRGRRQHLQQLTSMVLSNVRSFNNKYDEVSILLREHCPDIAVFTESWLDSGSPDTSLAIPGYAVARRDRNANGGGILCFVNNSFPFSVLDTTLIPSFPSCESELLSLVFSVAKFLLVCVYHPFWGDTQKNSNCILVRFNYYKLHHRLCYD
jgi:hypothetical protein